MMNNGYDERELEDLGFPTAPVKQEEFKLIPPRPKTPRKPKSSLNAVIVLRMALEVLSQRMLMYLAVIFSFSLFAWAMLEVNMWRFIGASAFTVFVFSFVLYLNRQKRGPVNVRESVREEGNTRQVD